MWPCWAPAPTTCSRPVPILALVLRTAAISLTALAVVLIGCSSGDGEPTPTSTAVPAMTVEEAASRGPYGVGVTTLEFVDETRPTAPNRDYAGAPTRTFPTEVWYPAAVSTEPELVDPPLEPSGGPYPLIVFAHGLSSFRRQSASYAQHLASHGYVVVSPDFPGSHLIAPGGPRLFALLDHPADVSFVIDEVLALSAEAGSAFESAIDGERIGVTGHSLGGVTAMLMAYGDSSDERIDAIVPISPPACLLPVDIAADNSGVPAMVIGGSNEIIVNPAWIAHAYEIAAAPKYFVSIVGADHIRFIDGDVPDTALPGIVDRVTGGAVDEDAQQVLDALGAEISDCPDDVEPADELISGGRQRELLRTVALPFFDAYLKDDPAAVAFLEGVLPTLEGIRFEQSLRTGASSE